MPLALTPYLQLKRKTAGRLQDGEGFNEVTERWTSRDEDQEEREDGGNDGIKSG